MTRPIKLWLEDEFVLLQWSFTSSVGCHRGQTIKGLQFAPSVPEAIEGCLREFVETISVTHDYLKDIANKNDIFQITQILFDPMILNGSDLQVIDTVSVDLHGFCDIINQIAEEMSVHQMKEEDSNMTEPRMDLITGWITRKLTMIQWIYVPGNDSFGGFLVDSDMRNLILCMADQIRNTVPGFIDSDLLEIAKCPDMRFTQVLFAADQFKTIGVGEFYPVLYRSISILDDVMEILKDEKKLDSTPEEVAGEKLYAFRVYNINHEYIETIAISALSVDDAKAKIYPNHRYRLMILDEPRVITITEGGSI